VIQKDRSREEMERYGWTMNYFRVFFQYPTCPFQMDSGLLELELRYVAYVSTPAPGLDFLSLIMDRSDAYVDQSFAIRRY
jgi:hypothetical protein